jgi:outer membrane lipoprotein-sorting protein
MVPLLLAALVTVRALPRPGAPTPDLFDQIYEKSRGVEASIRTVTARFTETTTTALLTRPLVSHGVLAVVRPDRIVLRYTNPEPHIVLIDGAQMTFSWRSRNIIERSDIGAARKRIDKYFVDKSPTELRRTFRITTSIAIDPANSWHITMQPTRSQISQGVSRLHLWIDRTSLLLGAIRIDFPNGDSKLMVFENVQVNGIVDPKLFSIDETTEPVPGAKSYSSK